MQVIFICRVGTSIRFYIERQLVNLSYFVNKRLKMAICSINGTINYEFRTDWLIEMTVTEVNSLLQSHMESVRIGVLNLVARIIYAVSSCTVNRAHISHVLLPNTCSSLPNPIELLRTVIEHTVLTSTRGGASMANLFYRNVSLHSEY